MTATTTAVRAQNAPAAAGAASKVSSSSHGRQAAASSTARRSGSRDGDDDAHARRKQSATGRDFPDRHREEIVVVNSPRNSVPNASLELHRQPLRGRALGSERQTEGQRAAAQRLRAWQERRRRSEDGDGGGGGREEGRRREVRGVRNYNVLED